MLDPKLKMPLHRPINLEQEKQKLVEEKNEIVMKFE